MIHLQHTSRRALSDVIITDLEGNESQQELMHCCHCDKTWVLRPGSGRVRGWCTCCCQVTCGSKECDTCVPLEKKLGW